MSVWSDIHKRSNGGTVSKENFLEIYNKDYEEDGAVLKSGTYKDTEYSIYTTGKYPFIKVTMEMMISVFSGYRVVKFLFDDGKYYEIDRITNGKETGFMYFFNKEDDYVEGEHDGKKHTLSELESIAKEIIDKILESEEKLGKEDID